MLGFLDLLRQPIGKWVGAEAVERVFEIIHPYLATREQADKLSEMRAYYNQGRYKLAFRVGLNLQMNLTHHYIPLYCNTTDFPDPLSTTDYPEEAGKLYGELSAYRLSQSELSIVAPIIGMADTTSARLAYHTVHGMLYYKRGLTLTIPQPGIDESVAEAMEHRREELCGNF